MKIGVFASSQSDDRETVQAVFQLGKALGEKGHTMVFGGCDMGLMRACCAGFYDGGSTAVGVVPDCFRDTPMFPGLGEILYTRDIKERKAVMIGLSDALVVLPGGIGTLDEFFTAWVQRDIGEFEKPVLVFDPFGFYEELHAFLNRLEVQGFVTREALDKLTWCTTCEEVVEALR